MPENLSPYSRIVDKPPRPDLIIDSIEVNPLATVINLPESLRKYLDPQYVASLVVFGLARQHNNGSRNIEQVLQSPSQCRSHTVEWCSHDDIFEVGGVPLSPVGVSSKGFGLTQAMAIARSTISYESCPARTRDERVLRILNESFNQEGFFEGAKVDRAVSNFLLEHGIPGPLVLSTITYDSEKLLWWIKLRQQTIGGSRLYDAGIQVRKMIRDGDPIQTLIRAEDIYRIEDVMHQPLEGPFNINLSLQKTSEHTLSEILSIGEERFRMLFYIENSIPIVEVLSNFSRGEFSLSDMQYYFLYVASRIGWTFGRMNAIAQREIPDLPGMYLQTPSKTHLQDWGLKMGIHDHEVRIGAEKPDQQASRDAAITLVTEELAYILDQELNLNIDENAMMEAVVRGFSAGRKIE